MGVNLDLAGLRGLILQWEPSTAPRAPESVSVAFQNVSHEVQGCSMGDPVLSLRMSKMMQLYQFAFPQNKFRPEWKGSVSLMLLFTPGSHLSAGILGKRDHQFKEM